MRLSDRYHKWVEWSEEDAVYFGTGLEMFFFFLSWG
jgi:hypothetical protein